MCWLTPTLVCKAQTIYLPSDRGSYLTYAGFGATATIFGIDGDSDSDEDDQGGTASASASAGGLGYVDVYLLCFTFIDGVTDPMWDPVAVGYAEIDLDAAVDESVHGYAQGNVSAFSWAYFDVLANQSHPTAGVDDFSATMHITLNCYVTGNYDDEAVAINTTSFGGNIGMAAGTITNQYGTIGTTVSIYNIDSTGHYWSASGWRSQSTSSNPTASSVEIDDTLPYPISDTYEGTVATHVGAETWVDASVGIGDYVNVGTSGMDEYPLTAFDERIYYAASSYEITVP
jgi:hypothetical protein